MPDSGEFLTLLQESLRRVTELFVLARRERLGIQSTKTPTENIFKDVIADDFPVPTTTFAEEYIVSLRAACLVRAGSEWLCEDDALRGAIEDSLIPKITPWGDLPPDSHIVGRHLLGGMIRYVDSKTGSKLGKLDSVELYTRMVSHIDLTELSFLASEILARIVRIH